MIPFAEFAPDKSLFDPKVSDLLENVLPQATSFGPFPDFIPFTDPLPARPQGAHLAYVTNGNYRQITGTQNQLLLLDPATLGWTDVSKPGGYSTPVNERWSFADFGTWVVATNGIDPIQYLDVSGTITNFADLSPDAPIAKFVGTIGDFIMALNRSTNDKSLQWSGLNQPQFWTPRQRSSDFQPFPDGGEIIGYSGFEKGCVVFQEDCIREGALALETALVMTFARTVENHGVVAPKSIVTTGAGIFYLSQDGFYRYGRPPVPIGLERVDRYLIDSIDLGEMYDVYGTEDPIRKVVYWAYRSKQNNTPRSYDRVLCYHYAIDKWSILSPGTIMTGLIDATTPGYTLDNLDQLGFNLDTLPFSLDSRVWSSGSPTLAAYDAEYRLGFFSGEPLQATLRTGAAEITPGRRTFVNGFRPLSDSPTMTGRVAVKERAGQMSVWKSSASANRTGLIPARASGRFHRFEVTIPAGTDWAHIHGVTPDVAPEGQQ